MGHLVSKRCVFISCGQYTDAEKRLGREIAKLVRNLTDLEPFFAEEAQDLNGLDSNILAALRDCVAFIVVLHPRGEILRPDGSTLVRASIWIEQEIAIATYIRRISERELPIMAFKHVSVGREGIRDLIQLNPIEFEKESEVMQLLPERLALWRSLKPHGIQLQLRSENAGVKEGHPIRSIVVALSNQTSSRISRYDCELSVPAAILKHWGAHYAMEVPCQRAKRRCFRFSEVEFGVVSPHEFKKMFRLEYCTTCALADSSALINEDFIEGRIFIENNQYFDEKTLAELAED